MNYSSLHVHVNLLHDWGRLGSSPLNIFGVDSEPFMRCVMFIKKKWSPEHRVNMKTMHLYSKLRNLPSKSSHVTLLSIKQRVLMRKRDVISFLNSVSITWTLSKSYLVTHYRHLKLLEIQNFTVSYFYFLKVRWVNSASVIFVLLIILLRLGPITGFNYMAYTWCIREYLKENVFKEPQFCNYKASPEFFSNFIVNRHGNLISTPLSKDVTWPCPKQLVPRNYCRISNRFWCSHKIRFNKL